MILEKLHTSLHELATTLDGKVKITPVYREIYATDASIYYEKPVGVAFPKNDRDVQKIILWANAQNCPIIPRGAGTSLAGQVVGSGLIVDVSRYMNQVLEVNEEENWVHIQPGIVLDELNQYLKKHNRLFGPETSTANRCVLGGMLGNNSCGLHSLVYGNVRDHVLEITGFLANGQKVTFCEVDQLQFELKTQQNDAEGDIYRHIQQLLSPEHIADIHQKYPDAELKRRNNGYALDALAETIGTDNFNFCKLITGSEGTLFFTTEIKLHVFPLPPSQKALMNIHCQSVDESLRANQVALKYAPTASELMDRPILELATKNSLQNQNLFFIHGTPGAVLMVEFWADSKEALVQTTSQLEKELQALKIGYSYPVVFNSDISKVWNVRKAGLGVLSNMPGDAKPTCIIEDTAVTPEKLPDYIKEMDAMLHGHGKEAVYYAHAGSGELHIRPIINLKSEADRKTMRLIAEDTLQLVKKYNGSISGEHGDGRLRGEFLEAFYGTEIYTWFKELKNTWDPNGLFNPNKIVNAPRMDENLRVHQEQQAKQATETTYTWDQSQGYLRAIENCTGSGDCRKSDKIGGSMCPSFMALKNEKHTTRARANALRSYMYGNKNGLNEKEVMEVLDLCLSCKACKSECPSNVDMAKMKAEFLHRYYQNHRVPLRSKMIGNMPNSFRILSRIPAVSNAVFSSPVATAIKAFAGFHQRRSLPGIHVFRRPASSSTPKKQTVTFFLDEFTQYNDGHIGAKAISLLENLGYAVEIPPLKESGRTYISKGMLDKAKPLARYNIEHLYALLKHQKQPIVGVEPSALLTLRDEYTDFFTGELKEKALFVAQHVFTIEEYLHKEYTLGNIHSGQFTDAPLEMLYHGHCYQKSLSSTLLTKEILSIPANYSAKEIPSGCCGMAGSFGYEKEHYEVSMKIGDLQLFPAVRAAQTSTVIVAAGTSCRHQIKDGTSKNALHPVEVLFSALLRSETA